MVTDLLQRLKFPKPTNSYCNDSSVQIVNFLDPSNLEKEEDIRYMKEYFVGRTRRIYIGIGTNIKVKMTQEWFEKIIEKKISLSVVTSQTKKDSVDVLEASEATKFIEDCVVGNITKKKLDI